MKHFIFGWILCSSVYLFADNTKNIPTCRNLFRNPHALIETVPTNFAVLDMASAKSTFTNLIQRLEDIQQAAENNAISRVDSEAIQHILDRIDSAMLFYEYYLRTFPVGKRETTRLPVAQIKLVLADYNSFVQTLKVGSPPPLPPQEPPSAPAEAPAPAPPNTPTPARPVAAELPSNDELRALNAVLEPTPTKGRRPKDESLVPTKKLSLVQAFNYNFLNENNDEFTRIKLKSFSHALIAHQLLATELWFLRATPLTVQLATQWHTASSILRKPETIDENWQILVSVLTRLQQKVEEYKADGYAQIDPDNLLPVLASEEFSKRYTPWLSTYQNIKINEFQFNTPISYVISIPKSIRDKMIWNKLSDATTAQISATLRKGFQLTPKDTDHHQSFTKIQISGDGSDLQAIPIFRLNLGDGLDLHQLFGCWDRASGHFFVADYVKLKAIPRAALDLDWKESRAIQRRCIELKFGISQ